MLITLIYFFCPHSFHSGRYHSCANFLKIFSVSVHLMHSFLLDTELYIYCVCVCLCCFHFPLSHLNWSLHGTYSNCVQPEFGWSAADGGFNTRQEREIERQREDRLLQAYCNEKHFPMLNFWGWILTA